MFVFSRSPSSLCQVEDDIPLEGSSGEAQQHSNHGFTQHMDVSHIDQVDSEATEYTTLCYDTSQDTHIYAAINTNQC